MLRLLLALALCHFCVAQVTTLEDTSNVTDDMNTTTTERPPLFDPCAKCKVLALRSKKEFNEYKWFKIFKRDEVKDAYTQAGIKSCEEFRWAYQCFQHCTKEIKKGAIYSYPKEYRDLKKIISKFCEDTWEDGRSCRMADTRICDLEHNKLFCGDSLKRYKKCVEDTLKASDQDCQGVCTPAQRYHKIINYEWDAECSLKRSIDGRCVDYVQLYCFSEMKDTEFSWGLFEQLNTDDLNSNLDHFCPVMANVSSCLMKTLTDTIDYYGLELTAPCLAVEDEIYDLVDKWENIIYPLCGGRANGTSNVQELCGVAPTTQRIPSTTTTLPPPTTPLKTKRIKIIRRLRKSDGSVVKPSMVLHFVGSIIMMSAVFT